MQAASSTQVVVLLLGEVRIRLQSGGTLNIRSLILMGQLMTDKQLTFSVRGPTCHS